MSEKFLMYKIICLIRTMIKSYAEGVLFTYWHVLFYLPANYILVYTHLYYIINEIPTRNNKWCLRNKGLDLFHFHVASHLHEASLVYPTPTIPFLDPDRWSNWMHSAFGFDASHSTTSCNIHLTILKLHKVLLYYYMDRVHRLKKL